VSLDKSRESAASPAQFGVTASTQKPKMNASMMAMLRTGSRAASHSSVVRNGVAAPLPSKGSSQIIGIVENPMIPAAAGTQPGVDWNLSKVQIAIKRPLELERNAKVLPFAHKKPLRSA
jgi:hypothetical protein